MSKRIPKEVLEQLIDRSGNKCEGIYRRVNGELERVGDCMCNGSYPLDPAHIRHAGMGGSKTAHTLDNLLHLCTPSHALFDERISVREYNRLIKDRRG